MKDDNRAEMHRPPEPQAAQGRPRLVILAVTAAFVLPILLAWATAFGFIPGWATGRVNNGELLPTGLVLPLGEDALATLGHEYGQWSVVVLTAPDCAPPCRLDDAMLHRFAQATAVDGERVFLYRAGSQGQRPPGVRDLPMSEAERLALTQLAGGTGLDALIIDHQRRPVLAYPAPAEPADILGDLRRLLRTTRTP